MIKNLYLLLPLFVVSACASVKDAGRTYFSQGAKVKGVEPAEAFIERMDRDKELRLLMYGQVKAAKIIQCTLLRNQFYVAAMKSSSNEIVEAAKTFEEAYQENDDAFLDACDQILGTPIGKDFMTIQQQYLTQAK
jgi:hypothetical protein